MEMFNFKKKSKENRKRIISVQLSVWQLQLSNSKLKFGIFVTRYMIDVCTLEPLKYLSSKRNEMNCNQLRSSS